ncbi:MAG: hypothetical protein ABIK31_04540 [candidate division WOR-3 bacterium]
MNIEFNNRSLLVNTEYNLIVAPVNNNTSEIQVDSEPQTKTRTIEITSEEKSFLMDIYNRPFISISERYKSMNLSAGKGTRIVKSLVRKNLCKIVEINLGGKGGNTKFLILTEKAFETIVMPEQQFHTKGGGFEHYFWQFKLAEHFKTMNKDWKVNIERQIMNKFIDIVIETKDKIIGIEVALTSVNEAINIQKNIEAGCDFVIIACKNNKILEEVEQIKNNLEQSKKNKVGICLLNKLLKCNSISEVIDSDLLPLIENSKERR